MYSFEEDESPEYSPHPKCIISNKPSVAGRIYELIHNKGEVTSGEIKKELFGQENEEGPTSSSTIFNNLERLTEVELIQKEGTEFLDSSQTEEDEDNPSRLENGTFAPLYVYRPEEINLEPETFNKICELRSMTRYDICELAVDERRIDGKTTAERLNLERSAALNALLNLNEKSFLKKFEEEYLQSTRKIQLTEKGTKSLEKLEEPEEYLDLPPEKMVRYKNGVEGTDFFNTSHIEIAFHLYESEDDMQIKELADKSGRNYEPIRRSVNQMEEEGLVESEATNKKFVFEPTEKTEFMIGDVRLYSVSRKHEMDIYSLKSELPEQFSRKDLYNQLQEKGLSINPEEVDKGVSELKNLDLIEGNTYSGYSFKNL